MTRPVAEVEAYLDDLFRRLRGTPRAVRRMLAETESHLYTAVEDAIALGADKDSAGERAVAQFGPAELVARTWNAHAPGDSLLSLVRKLAADLSPLAGVGMLAVGVSGILARAMAAVWGLRFMFADPPGTTYAAASCRSWMSIHPHAATCTGAYLAESIADDLQARYVVGVLGVLVLVASVVVRHRHREPLFATSGVLGSLTGAASFAIAAIGLAALAADDLRLSSGNGAGQWLSGALVAAPLALAYAWRFQRAARRTPSVD